MADVYTAVTDKILINMARYFPFIKETGIVPGAFEWQARMLGQMGQINRETEQIILDSLGGSDEALRQTLENAILNALKDEEPALRKAAEQGLANGPGFLPPQLAPNQMQAFQYYYRQSADKLNLVNTVMLESTEAAYRETVSDAMVRIQRTQKILNNATGEVVTGVSSWNTAMHDAVKKMVDNGLTGFIDHGGHRWSPEAYAAMDIKTTVFNTARAAVWERADAYGVDTYQVSSHNGARPLCYPWQGKVISKTDNVRDIEDLNGNTVHVYAQSETSYGEAAGLFGVNCKHYPMTFIPGVSTIRDSGQDPEDNEKTYAESQQQRKLERKLREEKRDLEVMKAQGADPEAIRQQQDKVRKASADIDQFCDETGRARRRSREYRPVDAKFGGADVNAVLKSKPEYGIVDTEIDELTPCLRRASDGQLVETTINKYNPTKASTKYWQFDWTKPQKSGYDVYALRVKGNNTVQGLIAFKPEPSNRAIRVDIIEAAPHNNKHNPINTSKTKEYSGVGGHLFAEACKKSMEAGYGGYVYFKSKTNLMEYYQTELGATIIDPKSRIMAIDESASVKLIQRYYGEEL